MRFGLFPAVCPLPLLENVWWSKKFIWYFDSRVEGEKGGIVCFAGWFKMESCHEKIVIGNFDAVMKTQNLEINLKFLKQN